jgi:hypothetical protein
MFLIDSCPFTQFVAEKHLAKDFFSLVMLLLSLIIPNEAISARDYFSPLAIKMIP